MAPSGPPVEPPLYALLSATGGIVPVTVELASDSLFRNEHNGVEENELWLLSPVLKRYLGIERFSDKNIGDTLLGLFTLEERKKRCTSLGTTFYLTYRGVWGLQAFQWVNLTRAWDPLRALNIKL